MSVQTNFSTKNKVDELVGFSLENADSFTGKGNGKISVDKILFHERAMEQKT